MQSAIFIETEKSRSTTNLAIAFPCGLVAISIVTLFDITMAWPTHRITPPATGAWLVHLHFTVFT
jgi:hypothetical protein